MKLIELPWDSSHFGIKAAKLDPTDDLKIYRGNSLTDFDYIRARVPTTDTAIVTQLQELGFRIYDTLVYMELKLSEMNGKKRDEKTLCRWSTHYKDVEQMRQIARSSFTFDHHHQDPRFSKEKVDEMHALWVDKCIREDYEIDVAERDGKVAGFIATKKGYIELIAVDETFRGLGIAEDLTRFALTRAAFDIDKATVETQVANVPAVRLYEKLGFRLAKSAYTLHFWGKTA